MASYALQHRLLLSSGSGRLACFSCYNNICVLYMLFKAYNIHTCQYPYQAAHLKMLRHQLQDLLLHRRYWPDWHIQIPFYTLSKYWAVHQLTICSSVAPVWQHMRLHLTRARDINITHCRNSTSLCKPYLDLFINLIQSLLVGTNVVLPF